MLSFDPIPVPLQYAEGGRVVRVAGTRVSLDTIVREFRGGLDPAVITAAYPTVGLADVCAVVAYYLRNREAVDAYVAGGEEEAEALRREIEAGRDGAAMRSELLARRAHLGQGNAVPAR